MKTSRIWRRPSRASTSTPIWTTTSKSQSTSDPFARASPSTKPTLRNSIRGKCSSKRKPPTTSRYRGWSRSSLLMKTSGLPPPTGSRTSTPGSTTPLTSSMHPRQRTLSTPVSSSSRASFASLGIRKSPRSWKSARLSDPRSRSSAPRCLWWWHCGKRECMNATGRKSPKRWALKSSPPRISPSPTLTHYFSLIASHLDSGPGPAQALGCLHGSWRKVAFFFFEY